MDSGAAPGGVNIVDYVGQLQRELRELQTVVQQNVAVQATARDLVGSCALPSNICRKPDVFDGRRGQRDRLEDWLYKMDLYLEARRVPNDLRTTVAASFLDGDAMKWYRSIVKSKAGPDGKISYEAFVAEIRAEFRLFNQVKLARDQLARLCQRKSVADFVREFRSLCIQIDDMSEAEKLDKFVRGLKRRVREEVELQEPKSFEEAARKAERIDDISFAVRVDEARYDRRGYASTPMVSSGPEPMQLGAALVKQQAKPDRVMPRKCFNCGKPGHIAKNCREPKRRFGGPRPGNGWRQ